MSETRSNVPKVRFPEFSGDWEQRKLGELVSITTGKLDADAAKENGQYAFFTCGKEMLKTDTYSFEGNAILISGNGDLGFTRKYSGKFNAYQRTYVLQDFCIDFEYLEQVIHKYLPDRIRRESLGGAMPYIKLSTLSELSIPAPCPAEAKRLASFLSGIDHFITIHTEIATQYKLLKRGLLQKMFPQNGATVPEIRFPGFTGDWEQRKVQDVYKITRGYVLAAPETAETASDKMPYPVYSSQTKNNGLMGYYKDYLYENAITWTTDGANAGTVNYRAGKFYCTNVCGVLLSDEGYSNKCAAEALNSVAWKWVSHVGNPKLMNNVMGEIPITLPKSVEEQNHISEFLVQIDSLITLQTEIVKKLELLKKGLLQQMFI